ncbi:unnamed protein product [Protopolystoma xenopodis]|uniref:Uncharacterized protein n=1 Tax=Protopolystoma xenopodis TaxID=117903 RepID=A0A448XMN7_9PLAT|nr:unnamed protein product [Protopolystoma xenopodis]
MKFYITDDPIEGANLPDSGDAPPLPPRSSFGHQTSYLAGSSSTGQARNTIGPTGLSTQISIFSATSSPSYSQSAATFHLNSGVSLFPQASTISSSGTAKPTGASFDPVGQSQIRGIIGGPGAFHRGSSVTASLPVGSATSGHGFSAAGRNRLGVGFAGSSGKEREHNGERDRSRERESSSVNVTGSATSTGRNWSGECPLAIDSGVSGKRAKWATNGPRQKSVKIPLLLLQSMQELEASLQDGSALMDFEVTHYRTISNSHSVWSAYETLKLVKVR